MYQPLSPTFHRALRTGYRFEVLCSAWRFGVRLPWRCQIVPGSTIRQTGGTGVRATLTATLAPEPGLYDDLAQPGTQLRPTWVMHHTDGRPEMVPLGRFDVDDQRLSYGPGATVSLTAPDTWQRVITARLESVVSPKRATDPIALAAAHVRGAVGDLTGELLAATATRVWGQVYERDRAAMVADLLDTAGMVGFVDRLGRLVIRPKPVLQGAAVWRVRAGNGGVLAGGSRSTSRQGFFNVVVVTPAGAATFRRFVVADTDPASPTRVRPGLRVPAFLEDPALRTRAAAEIPARAMLAVGVSTADVIEVSGAPHPGLDADDLVSVSFPPGYGSGQVPRRVIAGGVDLPLGPGVQAITAATPRDVGSIDQEVA